MICTRAELVAALADAVARLRLGHPVRVGIDGRSAAGKTTLADELADALRARGRTVLRAQLDDWHRPGHKLRSEREQWTPQSYYEEGRDYAAIAVMLLVPLGPGGSRRCRTALFDSYHDRPIEAEWQHVPDDAIAVIDGGFLLHPELTGSWDFIIWVEIDTDTLIERARRRDVAWVGSADVVERRYRTRTIPAHDLYERLTDAPARAHAVIDSRDIDRPVIVRLTPP